MDTAPRLLSIAGGVLLLFVGVAMLSPRTSSGRSPPSSAGRRRRSAAPPGKLARGNSMRNPQRTASTAAALMIGDRARHVRRRPRERDQGVEPRRDRAIRCRPTSSSPRQDGFTPFVAGAGDAIAESPEAEDVSPVRSELGEGHGHGPVRHRHRPEHDLQFYTFDWDRRLATTVAGRPGRRRRDRVEGVRRGQRPQGRKPGRRCLVRRRTDGAARGEGHLRAAALLPDPRRCVDPEDTFDRSTSGRATSTCS